MQFNVKQVLIGMTVFGLGISNSYAATYNGTVSTTFEVSVQVQPVCTVNADSLAFSAYDPGNPSPDTQTTTVTTDCTNGTSYTIGLDNGQNGTGPTDRYMEDSNSDKLQYGLYQDQTDQTPWGNTVGTNTESGTGTGQDQPYTVYGSIPIGQNVTKGSYNDQITVSVAYSA